MLVLNDLVKRLDAISIDIGSMNDSIADVKNEVEILNARQNQMLTFIERADNNFTNLFERLERALVPPAPQPPTVIPNFTPEMVEQANEQLGIDLTVELVNFKFFFN